MAEGTAPRRKTARERILEGAKQVFSDMPYEQARVEDILQAAGISRPTFYRLFRNKEEVFVEVSDEHAPKPRSVRDRVLEGCREAFGQLGYQATRVEDVLAAAGVSRPTFYRIFSSKQHAYEELDTIAIRYVLAALERADRKEGDWQDHLDKVLDSYLDWRSSLQMGGESHSPGLLAVRRELLGQGSERNLVHAGLLAAVETLAVQPDAANMDEKDVAARKKLAMRLILATM